ncbi:MAG: CRISPR-associated RAMP protein Csx7 [Minicystis sp.]
MSAPRVDDFDLLRERIVLEGTLTTRTALHVGGGSGELDAVDLPVVKTNLGDPFIPGSSIKGVVRSTVEGLLRAAGIEGLYACNPLDENTSCGAPKDKDRGGPLGDHCSACRLFGSHLVASHVRFSDAHLARKGGLSPLEKRDGVSIDRDLRVAADKRKYDVEVVSPGTTFSLEILVQNPEPWSLGLLLAGLDPLKSGFTALGGFTSRGLGRVDITWTSLTRMTAKQLLTGTKPARFEQQSEIEGELDRWRAALAARAEGRS